MGEAKDTGQSPRVPGGVRRGRQEAGGGAQGQGCTAHAHRGTRWSAGSGSRQASVAREILTALRKTDCFQVDEKVSEEGKLCGKTGE